VPKGPSGLCLLYDEVPEDSRAKYVSACDKFLDYMKQMRVEDIVYKSRLMDNVSWRKRMAESLHLYDDETLIPAAFKKRREEVAPRVDHE
jgi:hypothetical protein